MSKQAETIDAELDAAVERGAVAGLVAVVANRDGIIYEHAAGGGGPNGTSMATDAIFRIASMTKALTCLSAMQLVERGLLTLDDPLRDILPELAGTQVLAGFDAANVAQLRPRTREVTLRQLLTHTAGFSYEFLDANFDQYMKGAGIADGPDGPGFLKVPLIADPGTAWNYGLNTDWAGRAVQVASGQRVDDYFRENITEPLKLVDTGFVLDDAQASRLVTSHRREEGGGLAPATMGPAPKSVEHPSAGGGLYATARDYATFIRAFLGEGSVDGTQILSPDSIREMGKGQIGDIEVTRMRSCNPGFSNDFDLLTGVPTTFGLGFLINRQPVAGGRSAGSMAWAGIFNTYYWIDPTQDIAGVFMSQALPFCDAPTLRAFEGFERATYRAFRT